MLFCRACLDAAWVVPASASHAPGATGAATLSQPWINAEVVCGHAEGAVDGALSALRAVFIVGVFAYLPGMRAPAAQLRPSPFQIGAQSVGEPCLTLLTLGSLRFAGFIISGRIPVHKEGLGLVRRGCQALTGLFADHALPETERDRTQATMRRLERAAEIVFLERRRAATASQPM